MKISIPQFCNDPFESESSSDVIDNFRVILENKYKLEGSNLDSYFDIAFKKFNNLIRGNGIISLSETCRNFLMWAHYADHHKGMCIGISPDFIEHKDAPSLFNSLKPKKVFYDNLRFDKQVAIQPELFVIEHYMNHVLKKSDEWIYEKEHRVILDTSFSDKLIINESDNKILLNDIGKHCSINELVLLLKKEGFINYQGEHQYTVNKEKNFSVASLQLTNFKEVTFLIDINPYKIKSIYFGCRTDMREVRKAYQLIKSPISKLKHVVLYKYILSKKRFELCPVELNDAYFEANKHY